MVNNVSLFIDLVRAELDYRFNDISYLNLEQTGYRYSAYIKKRE